MVGNLLTNISGSPGTAIRNIASGVQGPGQNGAGLTNGSNPQINTRTSHYNESGMDLYTLAVVYSGWISKNPAFINCTDSYTVTASIEYPSGTFTQITWGGSTSAAISPGANVASDMVGVFIPKNAQFWVRTHGVGNGTGTLPISSVLTANNGELGEQAASGLADKTMSGTISGTVSTLRPSAILSRVPAKMQSWAGIGDSLMCGAPADNIASVLVYDAHGNAGCFGRSFSGLCPFINIATGGTTVNSNQSASTLAGPLGLLKLAGITDLVTNFGVNDLNTGVSLANIKAAMLSFWGLFTTNGQRVHQSTITPACTSSNAYINPTYQAFASGGGAFSGGSSSLRAQLNQFIRILPGTLHDFLELAWNVETSPDSGYWASGNSFNSALLPIDTWTCTGTPTTTSIPSTATRSSSTYYNGATWLVFTSGAASPAIINVSGYNPSGGVFTVGTLTTAPSAGDTFQVYPNGCQCTIDGFHPDRILNTIGATGVSGGEGVLLPVIQNYIKSLNPTLGTGGAGTIAGGDTPLTISGCQLWLQADDLTTIQEGAHAQNVVTWLDKSGNSNHVTQFTAGLTPNTGQKVINNRNALNNFTGSGFLLPSSLYGLPTGDHTVFMVLASANSGDATQYPIIGYTAGPSLRWGMELTSTVLGVQSRSSSNSFTTQNHTLDTSTICIGFNCQVGGNSITSFINGAKGSPTAAVESVTLTSMLVGGGTNWAANRFNGNISDIIIFNSALTNAQMNQVGQYLAALRGFTWSNW